jgi:hypothetical protein
MRCVDGISIIAVGRDEIEGPHDQIAEIVKPRRSLRDAIDLVGAALEG